jgi:hypothetical protein
MSKVRWQVGFAVLGVLGLVLACSSDKSTGSDDDDSATGGRGSVVNADPRCPNTMPVTGNGCSITDAECPYGSTLCTCDGSWTCEFGVLDTPPSGTGGRPSTNTPTTNTPPASTCPDAAPETGSSCQFTFGGGSECSYGDVVCECAGNFGNAEWECTDTSSGTGGSGVGGRPPAGGAPPTGGTMPGGAPPTAGTPSTAGAPTAGTAPMAGMPSVAGAPSTAGAPPAGGGVAPQGGTEGGRVPVGGADAAGSATVAGSAGASAGGAGGQDA